MKQKDGRTTNPLLLKRVGDWADQSAWWEFFSGYDALIRLWCRGYGLDVDSHEELCQQIWIELAERMRTYQYDAGKTFRGWLRQFCHSRQIDLLRKRAQDPVCYLAEQPAEDRLLAVDRLGGEEHEESGTQRSLLLCQAEQVQHAVRQRVEPQTWQVFWRIAVDGGSFRDTADEMGLSYAAVFAAHKRVARMLRAEGKRHLASRYSGVPEAISPNIS